MRGGFDDEQDGTANLTVGKVKGKAHVQLTFHGTGNILNFKQPKFGTGYVFTRKINEKIRVNGKDVPRTVGATFRPPRRDGAHRCDTASGRRVAPAGGATRRPT